MDQTGWFCALVSTAYPIKISGSFFFYLQAFFSTSIFFFIFKKTFTLTGRQVKENNFPLYLIPHRPASLALKTNKKIKVKNQLKNNLIFFKKDIIDKTCLWKYRISKSDLDNYWTLNLRKLRNFKKEITRFRNSSKEITRFQTCLI